METYKSYSPIAGKIEIMLFSRFLDLWFPCSATGSLLPSYSSYLECGLKNRFCLKIFISQLNCPLAPLWVIFRAPNKNYLTSLNNFYFKFFFFLCNLFPINTLDISSNAKKKGINVLCSFVFCFMNSNTGSKMRAVCESSGNAASMVNEKLSEMDSE